MPVDFGGVGGILKFSVKNDKNALRNSSVIHDLGQKKSNICSTRTTRLTLIDVCKYMYILNKRILHL